MSQASSGFTPAAQVQHGSSKDPLSPAYIPTEEERRVLRECNEESLLYRCLPLSAIAIGVTQIMIEKGMLTPSPTYGPLPKIVIAGLIGYICGKISYMRVCQEKFMQLENSPLGRALRQGHGHHTPSELKRSEFDPNPSEYGLESDYQPTTEVKSMKSESDNSYTSDYIYSRPSQSYDPTPFTSGFSDSEPIHFRDDTPPKEPLDQVEDVPKRKTVLYEELRIKNRENYHAMLLQKADEQRKRQIQASKNEVKDAKNGDAFEE